MTSKEGDSQSQESGKKFNSLWSKCCLQMDSKVVGWAVAVRVLLALRLIPTDLDFFLHTHSLGTVLRMPLYTLHPIQEAIAIRNLNPPHRFTDSYAFANEIPTPPLLLAALEPLVQLTSTSPYFQHVVFGILLLFVDWMIARRLVQIATLLLLNDNHRLNVWEARLERILPQPIQAKLQSFLLIEGSTADNPTMWTAEQKQKVPGWIGLLYFASPITILGATCFQCYQNLRVLFLLSAMWEAIRGSSVVWTAALGCVAMLIDPTLCVMGVPLALLIPTTRAKRAMFLFASILTCALLGGLTYTLIGRPRFVEVVLHTWMAIFTLDGAPPSLSIFWYTKMEMFFRFATYFQIMLTGLPFAIVIPASVRLYRYPVALIAMFWMVWGIFRPVSTLFELNVGLCLIALSPRSIARMNDIVSLVAICALFIPAILFVLLYWMWMEVGNGEANFLFFQGLAYNIFVVILLLQFVHATVGRDKALLLTEKKEQQTQSQGS
eukprot:CAMPEP_0172465844 /NCGR_PEP_ID=MMETSP1065-20121228/54639_1 /TAXON_ID=265537 /ORGANISM="Amphiprora paludosa, Strain CCMP125" /LENGTH=492 /DNA_ID=CAMNT_0013222493 /DNA_START=51 /DNA_END=1529 /DNA_ORIENTATION=-